MKKTFIIVLFFSFALTVLSKSDAHLQFYSSQFHYGKIEQGSNSQRYIKFKNTGDRPLVIDHTFTSCGCTSATVSNEPILPGQDGTLTVKYDTHRIGEFNKLIVIVSNSDGGAKDVLRIDGTVITKEKGSFSFKVFFQKIHRWFYDLFSKSKPTT